MRHLDFNELRCALAQRSWKDGIRWLSEQYAWQQARNPATYSAWMHSHGRGARTREVASEHWQTLIYQPALHVGKALQKLMREEPRTSKLLVHSHTHKPLAPGLAAAATCTGDVLYGDELYRDERRVQPLFHSCFSPELFEAHDPYSQCFIVTWDAIASIADCLPGLASAQSVFAELVAAQLTITHVPELLSERSQPRLWSQPTPQGDFAPPETHPASCAAGNVDVSVIIPAKDKLNLTRQCLDSIVATNPAGTFELILIDNNSQEEATLKWLEQASVHYPGLTIIRDRAEFNWSRLNNLGAQHARGNCLVFLNNDTIAETQSWLSVLCSRVTQPGIGAVGARLLYPNRTVQHAGVVYGMCTCAGHLYAGVKDQDQTGIFYPSTLTRNVSAVTGACLAVSREAFDAVGGFDEAYRISGSDVAFCLDLVNAGLRNVYEATVQFVHFESASRFGDPRKDVDRLLDRLAAEPTADPHYSPHLSLEYRTPVYSHGLWR